MTRVAKRQLHSAPGVYRLRKNLTVGQVLTHVAKGTHWLYEPKTGQLQIVPPLENAEDDRG